MGLIKLNENVKRQKYLLPTMDSIIYNLAGSTVYSTLDAASRCWQIALGEDSAKLTTFITHKGRYCFKRLPFGVTSAPDIFQREMQKLLQVMRTPTQRPCVPEPAPEKPYFPWSSL